MTEATHLADVNVLIALHEGGHPNHRAARRWFDSRSAGGAGGGDWATCLLTEAGFVRIMTNPKIVGHSMAEAMDALALLTRSQGHRFWPMVDGLSALSTPFAERLFGHQQVTDACLLGLAVCEGGVLVTMDKGIAYLAGEKYKKNILVLSSDALM